MLFSGTGQNSSPGMPSLVTREEPEVLHGGSPEQVLQSVQGPENQAAWG